MNSTEQDVPIHEKKMPSFRDFFKTKKKRGTRQQRGFTSITRKRQNLVPDMHKNDPSLNRKVEDLRDDYKGFRVLSQQDLNYIVHKYHIKNLSPDQPRYLGKSKIKLYFNPSAQCYCIIKESVDAMSLTILNTCEPERREEIIDYVKNRFLAIGFKEPTPEQANMCLNYLVREGGSGGDRRILAVIPNWTSTRNNIPYLCLYYRVGNGTHSRHTIFVQCPTIDEPIGVDQITAGTLEHAIEEWKDMLEKNGMTKLLKQGISDNDIGAIYNL